MTSPDNACPHCGDYWDPDRPRLHDQCRRIAEQEARRDGWDWDG